MIRSLATIAFVAIGLGAGSASAQNLITNGSFEDYTPPGGSLTSSPYYRDMLVGSSDLPGWTIIGPGGTHISQVNAAYAGNAGYTFPAQDGSLWLDLAGYSDNAADGISQTVATTIGATYDFSFYLGNVSGGDFGSSSLANYTIGGQSFSCQNSTQTQNLSWTPCSQSFVATGASTTFTISNGDSRADYSNAIDNVVLTLASRGGAVPEPATWAMMIVGFGAIGSTMRQRRRVALA